MCEGTSRDAARVRVGSLTQVQGNKSLLAGHESAHGAIHDQYISCPEKLVHQEGVASSSRQSQPRARQDSSKGREGCVAQ